jgi:hypothetical protein
MHENEDLTPKSDVHAFTLILFEVLFGKCSTCEVFIHSEIPEFLFNIIGAGLWCESEINSSFAKIFEILNWNDFQIVEGVNSSEVSDFISWIESAE